MTNAIPETLDAASQQAALAPSYADVVLDNLTRPYPYAAHHVTLSVKDLKLPQQIHPAFYTSFDWHSCVHMHALGVMLLKHGLDDDRDAALRHTIGTNLKAEKLQVEGDYLRANSSWERPYGWAWLVRLAATCVASNDYEIRGWGQALDPLVDVVAELLLDWAVKAEWPIRHGLHTNSAFGLSLMLDSFRALGRTEAAAACETTALTWFRADANWPGDWELSGQDFLSAGLSEADLLRRVLGADEFASWFAQFLPGLSIRSRILQPVSVSDENDGYMVHLHGLNLSRAGQVARIIGTLDGVHDGGEVSVCDSDKAGAVDALRGALAPLLRTGLDAVVSQEFLASHWLATYAWDALQSTAALKA